MSSYPASYWEGGSTMLSHGPIAVVETGALPQIKKTLTEHSITETLLPDDSSITPASEPELARNSTAVSAGIDKNLKVNPVSNSKVTIYQAIGTFSMIILIGGALLVLGTLSFLIFLWFGEGPSPGGTQATSTWRTIMLNDWLPQVITLASVVIRVAIAAQIAVCTSMCAALILERRRVRKSQAARFSIARSVNDGPWNLIWALLTDVPTQTFFHPESILILFLGLAALAAQFTSTILLSDLGDASLAQFPSTVVVNMTAENNTYTLGEPYWGQRPRTFASFGESPPGYAAHPNEQGLSDTGLKRRAFLPFSDEGNRTSLRSYEGQTFVLSSRVACMPPTFGNAQFVGMNYSDRFSYGAIEGEIQYEDSFASVGISSKRLCNHERCLPTSFGCSIYAIDDSWENVKPGLSFCFPELINTDPGSPSYWGLDDDPWGPESSTVLVISSDVTEDYWNSNINEIISTPNYTTDNEWAKFELQPGRSVNISLCFMGLNVMSSDISLVSDTSERTSIKVKRSTTHVDMDDTTDIQVLLGADPAIQSFTEREVFEIRRIEDDPEHAFLADRSQSIPDSQIDTSVIESYIINTVQALRPNATISACTFCTGFSSQAANNVYASIFSGIIQRSNRAAVALQSVYTVLTQTVFYDLLDVYDRPYQTHVISSKTAKIPRQTNGLIAVIILTALSLIAVGVMTALFCKHVHYTMIGETWHTLSQTVSAETEAFIYGEGILRDSDVEDMIKAEDHYVKLQRSVTSGRVEVMRTFSACGVIDWLTYAVYRLVYPACSFPRQLGAKVHDAGVGIIIRRLADKLNEELGGLGGETRVRAEKSSVASESVDLIDRSLRDEILALPWMTFNAGSSPAALP